MLKYVFSFFIFLMCLAGTEAFFQINSQYHFFSPKEFVGNPKEQKGLPFLSIPEDIGKEVQLEAQKMSSLNKTEEDWLQSHQGEKDRKVSPVWPEEYIAKYRSSTAAPVVIEDTVKNAGHLVYHVWYHFDKNGFREVPGQQISSQKKNIVLLGCSTAFGQSVNDNETLAYFLKQKMPRYNVINLGVSGGGLGEMFRDIEVTKRPDNINNKGGVAVYEMSTDHIERTLCFFDCYRPERGWIFVKDQYTVDRQGQVHNLGPYETSRPGWYNRLMFFLASSEFLRFIGFKTPGSFTVSEELEFVKYIKAVKSYYNSRGMEFFVFSNDIVGLHKEFLDELSRQGIKYYFYKTNVPTEVVEHMTVTGDGHFSAIGNHVMASLVADILKQNGY